MSAVEVGSKLEGKVTGITNFGAFVELPDGVTGLVHISEIADQYVKDVNDFLKVNDIVKVKVINVEENGKIGLSIKQAQDSRPKSRASSRRKDSFEDKISKFLRESEDRLMSLKRQMDTKRGGRGSRR
ncbi:RNA binding S1 domain protein [Caldalkalibacillus thermarum TA2.A1]|uniref:RNA binding S1 domain protein n=1 Tax=Caldalkalibacillus thermarum (strain TA2.A1) TaxID=986075 RepID=F5LA04_CALTT|nr:S1 domain-containing RNA-binding protein [Caldalkalibacillus thermarum]EGL81874.1 RNA binding S1 domain protein [Caldalkalibacillus thermarum TA2.A1]QZT34361.1 RNA-binding protein S1 [Caldalkalibacillus thermarum TA2.A1]